MIRVVLSPGACHLEQRQRVFRAIAEVIRHGEDLDGLTPYRSILLLELKGHREMPDRVGEVRLLIISEPQTMLRFGKLRIFLNPRREQADYFILITFRKQLLRLTQSLRVL